MRRSHQQALRHEKMISFILSLLAGIGALTKVSLILSAFAIVTDLSDSGINALSGIALAAGCFACSYCASNRRRHHGLIFGFICGLTVFIFLLIIGALTVKLFSAKGFFVKLLIILSASAIGGIKGVNAHPIFTR